MAGRGAAVYGDHVRGARRYPSADGEKRRRSGNLSEICSCERLHGRQEERDFRANPTSTPTQDPSRPVPLSAAIRKCAPAFVWEEIRHSARVTSSLPNPESYRAVSERLNLPPSYPGKSGCAGEARGNRRGATRRRGNEIQRGERRLSLGVCPRREGKSQWKSRQKLLEWSASAPDPQTHDGRSSRLTTHVFRIDDVALPPRCHSAGDIPSRGLAGA